MACSGAVIVSQSWEGIVVQAWKVVGREDPPLLLLLLMLLLLMLLLVFLFLPPVTLAVVWPVLLTVLTLVWSTITLTSADITSRGTPPELLPIPAVAVATAVAVTVIIVSPNLR